MPLDDRLFVLLRSCPSDQIEALWSVDLKKNVTDEGFAEAAALRRHELISAELRSAAGHTVDNIRRGAHDLAWDEVLERVASWLDASVENDPPSPEGRVRHTRIETIHGARYVLSRGEETVMALVRIRMWEYMRERGVEPDAKVFDDESIETRVRLEDESLRTIRIVNNVTEYLNVDRRSGEKQPGPVRLLARRTCFPPLDLLLAPSPTKVIPAVARLLQTSGAQQ